MTEVSILEVKAVHQCFDSCYSTENAMLIDSCSKTVIDQLLKIDIFLWFFQTCLFQYHK